MILREAFDYPFSRLDPLGDHIDPPSVAIYETLVVKGPDWKGAPDARGEVGCQLRWARVVRHVCVPGSASIPARAATPLPYWRPWSSSVNHAQPGRKLWYWDPVDTARAADERTLVFRLHHPYSRLPALLWGTHTAVYNEALRARDDDGSGRTFADGTGPFRLVSWSPERVVAEAWQGYPGALAGFLEPGPERLARIEWISILDEHERLDALERGEVDCMHGPPLAEVARLVRRCPLRRPAAPAGVEHVPEPRLDSTRPRLRRSARPASRVARRESAPPSLLTPCTATALLRTAPFRRVTSSTTPRPTAPGCTTRRRRHVFSSLQGGRPPRTGFAGVATCASHASA